MGLHLVLLHFELRRWRRSGQVPLLWWRDDDTRHETPELRRLLSLSDRYACPMTLAVIPSGSLEGLGQLLSPRAHVRVAQHGVSHTNIQPAGVAPDEFRAGAVAETMAAAIRAGSRRLGRLPNVTKLFVPAWNRITPEVAKAVGFAGLNAISGHGEQRQSATTLARLDVHVDLLRWRGGARFRGEGRCLRRLFRLLRARRRAGAWAEPIGLLTHHLDFDERSWAFLETLLALTSAQGLCRWACVTELLPASRASTAELELMIA